MLTTARLGWLESKLLVREPLTLVFSLALPFLVLLILGGVFGNTASAPGQPVFYRGWGLCRITCRPISAWSSRQCV